MIDEIIDPCSKHLKRITNINSSVKSNRQIQKEYEETSIFKNFSLFYGSDGIPKYEKTFIFKMFPLICHLISWLGIMLLVFDIALIRGKFSYYLCNTFISLFYINSIVSSLIIVMILFFAIVICATYMASVDVYYTERV